MSREVSRSGSLSDDAVGDLSPVFVRIPYFDDMSMFEVKQLMKYFSMGILEIGDAVHIHDEMKGSWSSEGFHVIIRGKVRISTYQGNAFLTQKGSGEWFGDTALVGTDLKAVHAIAVENNTRVMSITHERFMEFVKINPKLRAEISTKNALGGVQPPPIQLKSLPFFQDMKEIKIRQLAVLLKILRVDGGVDICKQGDPCDGFYIIVKGTVTVSWSSPDGSRHVLLDTLQNGEWFGETALLSQTPRTATVRSVRECIILFLGNEEFNSFLRIAPELAGTHFRKVIQHRTANMLKTVAFFHPLIIKRVGPLNRFDESKLTLLSEMFHYYICNQGEAIYREGEVASSFYILIQGSAEMSIERPQDGHRVVFDTLHSGDYFGEIALLNEDSLRANTVVAVGESRTICLKLDRTHFQKFFEVAPELKDPIVIAIRARTVQSLRNIPFFGGLLHENRPWSKLSLLASLLDYEHAQASEVIYREGDTGDKFYLIVVGSVEIIRELQDDSKEHIDLLRAGECFGENMDHMRSSTAIASEPCVLLTLTKYRYTKFLNLIPEAQKHINELSASRNIQPS